MTTRTPEELEEKLHYHFKNKELPNLVLALEFEDNFVDWSQAWYEMQILL